ncbi:sperm motility kinase Z-like [Ctenodactylus gundi]
MPSSDRREPSRRQDLPASFPLEEILTRQYRVLRILGQGSFAQVVLAEHLLTGTKVAIKVLLKRTIPSLLTSEWDLMKNLRHPNVIKLLQIMETQDTIYLVTEYLGGGDLFRHLCDAGPLPEDESRRLFRQMVHGVRHCHDRGIVHRDLKPENLLLDMHGNICVSDFGLGGRFTPGQRLVEIVGTLPFEAPELVSQERYDGPAADAWSLGVILFVMVTRTFPFPGTAMSFPFPGTSEEVAMKILAGRYTCPPHLSPHLRDLIGRLLCLDPQQRPTMDQVLRHPWLLQDQDPEPAPEPLIGPKHTAILRVMAIMRHDPQDVLDSLQRKTFDEQMATYLILQGQARQGVGFTIKVRSADPEKVPSPSRAPPALLTPLPERRVCAPADRRVASQPRNNKGPCQEGGRSTSLPALHLHCQKVETRAPDKASLGGTDTPLSSPSITKATTKDKKTRGWKGIRKRIAACFRALCCCLPARKNQVAPM